MGMCSRLFFICLSLFVPSSSTSMKKHARGWTIIVMVSMGTVWYLCNYLRICWKYMFSFSTVNCRPLRISWRRWSCKYFCATEFVIKPTLKQFSCMMVLFSRALQACRLSRCFSLGCPYCCLQSLYGNTELVKLASDNLFEIRSHFPRHRSCWTLAYVLHSYSIPIVLF